MFTIKKTILLSQKQIYKLLRGTIEIILKTLKHSQKNFKTNMEKIWRYGENQENVLTKEPKFKFQRVNC